MWDVENLTCRECGQSLDEHADPEKDWYAYRSVDYAAMVLAAANAQYAALHELRPFHNGSFTGWAAERSPEHPYHFMDGVRIGVAGEDLHPGDDFLTNERARPSTG